MIGVAWYIGGWCGAFAQTQTQSKMLNTKHNLGVSGPGSIRASGENQLCVFCHTPHVPKQYAAQQLWNHRLSSAEYVLYSSDYLTNLEYPVPNQPTQRSKLCLSCHDGTIAIGAVYNDAGPRVIEMRDAVTTIPANALGNLGTSLKNDHPVGFIYDVTKDPELVSRTWPWKTPVKLDPDAAIGTLECITCHDPHDDTFGKFLRINNTNAALCSFCHTKTGWSDAAHRSSTQSYTPAGGNPTTVGEWACRSCHQSHGGEGVPYLLKATEEITCFGSGCHGETLTGANTKNIQSEYTKIYNHPTVSVSGRHKNPDNTTSLSLPNRHAECQDCHNSHQAKKELHALQSNAVSGVLKGVSGVLPGIANIWTQPTMFTEMKPAAAENQVCFKCHSAYALGNVPNGVSSIIGPSGVSITDQAMEFNQANHSAHPVQVGLNAQSGSLIPKALSPQQMALEWNATGTQTMYCSDWHGNDQPTSASSPQGPHGSNARFMLTGQAKYWPTTAFGQLWSLDDIKNGKNNWQNDLFCVNCHPMATAGQFLNKVHNNDDHQDPSVKCITCHVAVPHGAQRSRLIGYASDVSPYNYSGVGTYDKLVVIGFQKASDPWSYEKNNCSMNGVCHGAQTGFYEP